MSGNLYITLVRHAKSDWDNDLDDHDRPLNHRGLKDAPMMGKLIGKNLLPPDLVISSSAVRALVTASLVVGETGNQNILIEPDLYHSGVSDFTKVLTKHASNHRHVIVFAHNPGISDFLYYLDSNALLSMPTCAVAHLQVLAPAWDQLTRNCGRLIQYWYPSMLK
ncbi:MAG TPA: histidine phosphatase family protein [Bacteroidales bacterium]|nr:histidine phosphatase family protein [Bacteroidales bacterium]